VAVVATLNKGYDLDYIWTQVDSGPVKDAASYYLQASQSGREPPGRWWGRAAQALGFEPGQTVEREPYDLLFGARPPTASLWAGPRPAAAKPPTCTRPCSRLSRRPPPNAATCASRP
jgi:hypothetical protein